MKLHFYGTGASEGVPALFCECKYCKQIRKMGGKNYRMRTCVQLDNDVLIDFSMDGYAQTLFRNLDLTAISHLLITHSHDDHLYPLAITQVIPPKAFYNRERVLNVYGNDKSIHKISDIIACSVNSQAEIEKIMNNNYLGIDNYLKLNLLTMYEEFYIGKYKVLPLPANHDKKELCMIYIIQDKEKTLLYGHDSSMFQENTWKELKRYKFDCVVLDCTMVEETGIFDGHMGLPDNIKVYQRMIEEGMASENTKFISTHFYHGFNPVHERITPIFKKEGFIAAYDGMEIIF